VLYIICATAAESKAAITITTERGFHVLTIDPSFYPKNTKKFELKYNGFRWGRYSVGKPIMLVRVRGLPNTVVITPLDKKGNHLEPSTSFIL